MLLPKTVNLTYYIALLFRLYFLSDFTPDSFTLVRTFVFHLNMPPDGNGDISGWKTTRHTLMFSRFFIYRPVFAWVISILIMLLGALAISQLPVEQYPDVAPPSVSISATYTGASAETLENSVTQILEQQLTGLDNLLYFTSSSSSQGNVSVDVTFSQGTDPDTAQVQVQNKVQQALSRLPTEVQQLGVTVTKSQSNFLLVMGLYDTTDKSSSSDIGDWLVSNMQEPLARAEGVGDIQVFGGQYAMRIWLDPAKLYSYALQPSRCGRCHPGAERPDFRRQDRRTAVT